MHEGQGVRHLELAAQVLAVNIHCLGAEPEAGGDGAGVGAALGKAAFASKPGMGTRKFSRINKFVTGLGWRKAEV